MKNKNNNVQINSFEQGKKKVLANFLTSGFLSWISQILWIIGIVFLALYIADMVKMINNDVSNLNNNTSQNSTPQFNFTYIIIWCVCFIVGSIFSLISTSFARSSRNIIQKLSIRYDIKNEPTSLFNISYGFLRSGVLSGVGATLSFVLYAKWKKINATDMPIVNNQYQYQMPNNNPINNQNLGENNQNNINNDEDKFKSWKAGN